MKNPVGYELGRPVLVPLVLLIPALLLWACLLMLASGGLERVPLIKYLRYLAIARENST